MAQQTYTAEQVAAAARALREAAGAEPEYFPAGQVVSMLGDEVRMLRERGFTEQRIADLFGTVDIAITPDDLAD